MQNEDIAETLAVRRSNEETRRLKAEANTRRLVREREQRAARVPYGNTSSYSPASDTCSAPFVPAAENYTPAPSDPSSSIDAGGGSFDGGGASGEY